MRDKKFDVVGPLAPFKVTSKWADALYWLRTVFGSTNEALDIPIRFRYTARTILNDGDEAIVAEASVAWFSLHRTEIHLYDWQQLREGLGKLGFSIAAKVEAGDIKYTVVEEVER